MFHAEPLGPRQVPQRPLLAREQRCRGTAGPTTFSLDWFMGKLKPETPIFNGKQWFPSDFPPAEKTIQRHVFCSIDSYGILRLYCQL